MHRIINFSNLTKIINRIEFSSERYRFIYKEKILKFDHMEFIWFVFLNHNNEKVVIKNTQDLLSNNFYIFTHEAFYETFGFRQEISFKDYMDDVCIE